MADATDPRSLSVPRWALVLLMLGVYLTVRSTGGATPVEATRLLVQPTDGVADRLVDILLLDGHPASTITTGPAASAPEARRTVPRLGSTMPGT